jgi:peroxiredoxin Q/BCP
VTGKLLGVGDRAPDFSLPDQDGKTATLRDLLGTGCLVLYFYPKDDTPGCTAEACSFRDQHEVFAQAGACVVGVSSDDVDSHRRFADKYHLPFRLLADRGGELRAKFGVAKTLGLLDGRVSFVIDGEGIIRHTFNSQLRARRHVEEALQFVRAARAEQKARMA